MNIFSERSGLIVKNWSALFFPCSEFQSSGSRRPRCCGCFWMGKWLGIPLLLLSHPFGSSPKATFSSLCFHSCSSHSGGHSVNASRGWQDPTCTSPERWDTEPHILKPKYHFRHQFVICHRLCFPWKCAPFEDCPFWAKASTSPSQKQAPSGQGCADCSLFPLSSPVHPLGPSHLFMKLAVKFPLLQATESGSHSPHSDPHVAPKETENLAWTSLQVQRPLEKEPTAPSLLAALHVPKMACAHAAAAGCHLAPSGALLAHPISVTPNHNSTLLQCCLLDFSFQFLMDQEVKDGSEVFPESLDPFLSLSFPFFYGGKE